MTDWQSLPDDDPRRHTATLKSMLRAVADHAREDVTKVEDPKAKALFETTAEVVMGLVAAFEHFEQRSEAAWR